MPIGIVRVFLNLLQPDRAKNEPLSVIKIHSISLISVLAMMKSPLFWSNYRPDDPFAQNNRPQKRAYGWVWKILAGLLLTTLLIPVVLRWAPAPFSAFMLSTYAAHATYRYDWVPITRISPYLPIAVVAAEDQRFPQHWGFDFSAIGKAIEENKHRRRARGASTISQQVAKNLFLWSGGGYFRKGLEAYFTIIIELLWPKRRVLEVYLNIAEFGPGVFGAEAASRLYFNKPASQLSQYESALLTAVLPNPKKLRVARPSKYIQERTSHIYDQIELLGGPAYLKNILPTP